METTLQPSLQQNFRSRIALIEFIELALLGFGLGSLMEILVPSTSIPEMLSDLLGLQLILVGSWLIYNVYIRIARAGGSMVDIAIWVIASLATASYTFWAWTILDANRFLISKLFYRGEAPVEYAWSARSKQVRKLWEQTQKSSR